MISSPAGNDLLFDEASLEQGRNFNNKIWNALKLVRIWGDRQEEIAEEPGFAVQWFRERLNEAALSIDALIKQFRLSEALKVLYSLIWDDFCSWYLEWIKPAFGQPMPVANYRQTVEFFTELMQLLHPFMPFISEEVYHLLSERQDDICALPLKEHSTADQSLLTKGQLLQTLITDIRDSRNKNQIKPKDPIGLCLQAVSPENYSGLEDILAKQVNASSISFVTSSVPESVSLLSGKDTIYLQTTAPIDSSAQRESMSKEIDYLKGFIASVDKKLGNERFVHNAKPEVVELERRKKADAESKMTALKESLAKLV
jgi:valyl-tRNA synthetase